LGILGCGKGREYGTHLRMLGAEILATGERQLLHIVTFTPPAGVANLTGPEGRLYTRSVELEITRDAPTAWVLI
jgi:hypothetical protein